MNSIHSRCEVCGELLPPPHKTGGPERRTCSDACRQRKSRQHKASPVLPAAPNPAQLRAFLARHSRM
ncbi:MAG TPA: hypothetical protein VHM91_11240 [Verrucomicrobiales bacterium]|nr:hypothetical protein [Verrucomicrobiales bacterium]